MPADEIEALRAEMAATNERTEEYRRLVEQRNETIAALEAGVYKDAEVARLTAQLDEARSHNTDEWKAKWAREEADAARLAGERDALTEQALVDAQTIKCLRVFDAQSVAALKTEKADNARLRGLLGASHPAESLSDDQIAALLPAPTPQTSAGECADGACGRVGCPKCQGYVRDDDNAPTGSEGAASEVVLAGPPRKARAALVEAVAMLKRGCSATELAGHLMRAEMGSRIECPNWRCELPRGHEGGHASRAPSDGAGSAGAMVCALAICGHTRAEHVPYCVGDDKGCPCPAFYTAPPAEPTPPSGGALKEKP